MNRRTFILTDRANKEIGRHTYTAHGTSGILSFETLAWLSFCEYVIANSGHKGASYSDDDVQMAEIYDTSDELRECVELAGDFVGIVTIS